MYSQTIPSPSSVQEFIEGPDGIELSTVAWGFHHATHHLLFVHGGYQAKECYREQFQALALADCYVVGFDLPWHGRSGPAREESNLVPSLHILAQSLAAVRSHYQMSDTTIILAWSLGGLIVRAYLSGQTPAIGGLILVAPLLDVHEGMAASQKYCPEASSIFGQLSSEQEHFSGRTGAFLRFVELLTHPPRHDYYTLGYNAQAFFKVGAHLAGILTSSLGGEVESFLRLLQCPTLFVQGTQDKLLPPEYTRSNIARMREGQVTLLELPCGHSPHLEKPLQFNAAVFEFLQSLERRSSTAMTSTGGS